MRFVSLLIVVGVIGLSNGAQGENQDCGQVRAFGITEEEIRFVDLDDESLGLDLCSSLKKRMGPTSKFATRFDECMEEDWDWAKCYRGAGCVPVGLHKSELPDPHFMEREPEEYGMENEGENYKALYEEARESAAELGQQLQDAQERFANLQTLHDAALMGMVAEEEVHDDEHGYGDEGHGEAIDHYTGENGSESHSEEYEVLRDRCNHLEIKEEWGKCVREQLQELIPELPPEH